MWEVFSYGQLPYSSMTNKEATEAVLNGYRMPAPSGCPAEMYEMMSSCWQLEPDKRPSFSTLHTALQNLVQNKRVATLNKPVLNGDADFGGNYDIYNS
jgi:hypothetical protein